MIAHGAYPPSMFRMAVGHSDDVDLESALETAFAQCDAGLAGAIPKAGLLISAWGVDHQSADRPGARPLPGDRACRLEQRG